MSSLEKCLFKFFAHFLIVFFCLPGVELCEFFMYFGDQTLYKVSLTNMFSRTVGSLFTLMLFSFIFFCILCCFYFMKKVLSNLC